MGSVDLADGSEPDAEIFDRPLRGREFFEEIIRDNLISGVQTACSLVFDRVVTKKTPGEFRTRVIQEGVHPSLHINYKNFDLKAVLQRRARVPDGRNKTVSKPERFWSQQGLASEPAIPAETGTADQPAVQAGSRTRQPQQRSRAATASKEWCNRPSPMTVRRRLR